MKKLLAFLLALVMAASLAVPAFADGPDGPPPDDYYDGDVVPISANPDGDLGVIGGQDGPTAIITSGGLGGILNGSWWTADDDQELIDEKKEALGGVPGQIGVMVDGKYVKFPDAAPEISNNRTMIPVRALVETLGGEVEYQDRTVKFTIDGYVYTFVIGSTAVAVAPAAGSDKDTPKPDDITMDCAPYIKDNRTYVPIRFISEALGYEVGWDSAFRTAVLADKAAMAADIDKDFTILNKAQAAQGVELKEGESSLTDTKCSVKATMFDTLNGNKTYTADLTGKVLMNAGAVSGTCSVTLSDEAVDALVKLVDLATKEYDTDYGALVRTGIDGMKDMEVIMTAEGKVWAHAPVLDELTGKENVWGAMDLGAEMGALLALQMDASSLTIGSVVADMVDVNSVVGCSSVNEMVQMMAAIYGDDKFTTADGVSTLTFGLDDLAALAGADAKEVKEVFKTYEITMKVDEKGGAETSCVMETAAQGLVPGMKITVDAAQSDGKADMTMKIHVANLCEAELTMTSAESASGDAPKTEPPKDASIIDVDVPTTLPELNGPSAAQ